MTSGYYVRLSKEEYMDIPKKFRERATFFDNDFDKYKEDALFLSLYKEYRSLKKKLETRKHQLRHG